MALAIGGNSVNKAYLGSTEIQKMYLGSELVFDNSIQPSVLTPIMTNFRVEDATPTLVHFDTPLGYPGGLTTTGFVVSNATISSVTKVDDNGGYFTLSAPLTYLDNNTIKLESGDGTVYDFTYEHIVNNISEPSASQPYKYVADNATGAGDGSEGSPWTLSQAAANVVPGSYIAIKAGSYTPNTVEFLADGEVDNPIKLIGYKTSPNDISGHDWWNPLAPALDASEMPVFDGQNTAARGLRFNGDYYIIKNLSSQDYTTAQFTTSFSPHNKHFENMIAISTTGVNNYGFANESSASEANQRYINISIHSCGNTGIEIKGSRNLVKNCNFYDDPAVNTTMDYHIRANGMDHIIVNNFSKSIAITAQAAHGLCLKGSDIATERCLIADNEVVNIKGSIEFRHITVKNNVAKRNEIYADLSGDTGGFLIQNGASANIIEQNVVRNTGEFVRWYSANEEGGYATQGFDNIFINNLCHNVGDGIYNGDFGGAAPSNDAQGNLFQNNTFANINNLFGAIKYDFDNTNQFTNNIFDNITNLIGGTATGTQAFVFDYNLFFGGFTAQGTNTITIDPDLNASYQPQATFTDIDVPGITGIDYDRYGNERQDPTTVGSVLSAEEAPNAIPVYSVSTSELGMIENNESEALNNANKLIAGLNSTVDGVNVDGVYFIETPATSLTAADIRLASTNSGELKSNQSLTTLFTSAGINNIDVQGVTLSDVFSDGEFRLFYHTPILVESVNLIKFNVTTFNGNVFIYWKDWGKTSDPTTYKIGSFIFTNNFMNNRRVQAVQMNDVPIDICTITGNTIRNFDSHIFGIGASNDHLNESLIYTLRPLFTYTDNDYRNDIDWECGQSISDYITPCIFEANQVDCYRNHVEGIWTTNGAKAVYDHYLSCNIVNYKNNTNKNNVCFSASNVDRNTLVKMKGAADDYIVPKRYVENNEFIVEESWIDLVVIEGADKAYSWVNLFQTSVEQSNPVSTYIKNNTFNIYNVDARPWEINVVDYEISGNTFNIDYCNNIFTEYIELTDDNIPESVVFSNNTFNVLNVNSVVNQPAMVRFNDLRIASTDKIGSITVNGNTGNLKNYILFNQYYTDSFEMIGNNLQLYPDTNTLPYAWYETYASESNMSNNVVNYNTGDYFIGTNMYPPTTTINESVTFYGSPRNAYGRLMSLSKGEASAPDITYRRTYNVDDGTEIFYFEFTLSYDTDHWNVTFINTSDVEVTYQLNNNDGITDGNAVFVKINNTTGTTSKEIRFANEDGDPYSGFNQNLGTDSMKLEITTITT